MTNDQKHINHKNPALQKSLKPRKLNQCEIDGNFSDGSIRSLSTLHKSDDRQFSSINFYTHTKHKEEEGRF